MSDTGRVPRRRLSADERRSQIVAGTIAVVAEVGCANASADAIARAAGVSKGLLWHYFGSQDELYRQAMLYAAGDLRDTVAARVDWTAPAPELIRVAMHAAAGVLGSHRAQRRAIVDIVGYLKQRQGSDFGADDLDDHYSLQQEHIFERGLSEGTLRAGLDPRAMAVTYQSTVDGMLDYLDDHPDVDARAFVDHVTDVLLRGMQA